MASAKLEKLKIALVYDHLITKQGGAELVLKQLLQLFPAAPLYTSLYLPKRAPQFKQRKVFTTFLQRFSWFPFPKLLAPLHPIAFEQFNFQQYDIVISVTSGAAKGVITHPDQLHVCYLLTPPRYLFEPSAKQSEYIQSHFSVLSSLAKFLISPILSYLEMWDRVAAQRPDKIVAISKLVSSRSEKLYQRKTDAIIYPPFEAVAGEPKKSFHQPYFLCLSRLVSYKRFDLAVRAAKQNDKLLVIAGEGNQQAKLHALAGLASYVRKNNQSAVSAIVSAKQNKKNIVFLGFCTDEEKKVLLTNATALIMPGEEDFGLVGLEAAALGTPLITAHTSGIAEILTEPDYALHLQEENVSALSAAMDRVSKKEYDAKKLQQRVAKYTSDKFRDKVEKLVYQFWQETAKI